jgi:trimeric autotransporter adhesin
MSWHACSKRFLNPLRIFMRLTVAIYCAVSVLALATAAQANPSGLREQPEALQAAVSGAIGQDDRSYHLERAGENCRGANPAQQFEATWSEDGLSIQAGKLSWGLRLEAWGYGDELAPVGRAVPQAAEHRVEYHRSGLTEWYVNGPLGIEQGFTVPSPPKGSSRGEALTVRLAWSGEARVQVEQSAAVVSNFAGEPVLRYNGLSAHDAAGRDLRAWFEQRGAAILLRVDDREAIYPVVIDPLIQQQKLTASDGEAGDFFGVSVSLSSDGNTALIGANFAGVEFTSQGAVYVFVRNGAAWSQQQKLTASDGTALDAFGESVSLSSDGNTALIGAFTAAYVFVRSGGTWSQQQKLTASDGTALDLGESVSLSANGNTALIGAPNRVIRTGGVGPLGAAYVFVNSSGTWSQQQKLTASDGTAFDAFGTPVSLSANGSTALIGSGTFGFVGFPVQPAAYVFVNSSGTWSQQQKLIPSDFEPDDFFFGSLSLSSDGSTALFGASSATVGANMHQGAAYVFVNSGGTWSQQKLTASDGAAGDSFGISVSLGSNGSAALIGAQNALVGANMNQGAAYVFVNSGGTWSQQQKLTASDGVAGDAFGQSVSLSGDGSTALFGVAGAMIGGNTGQGAAYVFAAPVSTFSVSGTVTSGGSGLSGVTINLTGAATQNTTTNSSGNYSFSGLSNGMYKITPGDTGYTFTPGSISARVNGADLTGQDFTAAKVTGKAPGAPTGVTAAVTANNPGATVSFKLPASNGGSPITGFTVTSKPGGVTATGVGSPITLTGLTFGDSYTFAVMAKNAIGPGPASKPSNKVTPYTIPGAPLDVAAKAGNAEAIVSFKAPASNGSPIKDYIVTSSAGQTATGARSPIAVKGLTNGTAYTFTVTATNKAGTGPASGASNIVTPGK